MTIKAGVVILLAALTLAASSLSALASGGTATGCVYVADSHGVYQCVVPGRTKSSTVRTGHQAPSHQAPSCDIKSASPATFCVGSYPCFYKESVVPFLPPATKPPAPDAQWHVQMCLMMDDPFSSSWHAAALWVGQAPPPPSLVVQAREATGQILLPTATLAFNPTSRTLVNLDTWFWAEGLDGKELRGTSAFGLVAIATPSRLTVDPGDGSGSITCTWATYKSDECAYPYRRSSAGQPARGHDGWPAYAATATATWKLRFLNKGAPVRIVGAPTVLSGPGMRAAVEVAEVQTIVTSAG